MRPGLRDWKEGGAYVSTSSFVEERVMHWVGFVSHRIA